MRRAASALLSAAAVIALLTGCGAVGSTDASGPDVATSDGDTSGKPSDSGPAFPDGTARQSGENSGEWDLVFRDVRVAEHETFDRIVLDFMGTGIPGWTVNYVDQPRLEGSGEVVPLGGDAFLDIYASGTTYPESPEDYYGGPRHFEPEDGGDVGDVYVGGTFEGYTQVLLGLRGERVPFRVFALSDPSRLVIDVADDSTD